MTALPFDGTVLVQAGALASVPASRLAPLLRHVQDEVAPEIETYRRTFERVVAEPGREAFLVDADHWNGIADRLGLDGRERDAVVRAHETQLERLGSVLDRRAEFASALEIRSAVVIGVGGEDAQRSE